MANFLESLRMQNIFGNKQPLGMPSQVTPDSINPMQLFNYLQGIKHNDEVNAHNNAAWDRSSADALNYSRSQPQPNRIAQIGDAMRQPGAGSPDGMNHVFNPNPAGSISPLDQAKLSLERQKFSADSSLNQAKLAIDQYKATNPGMRVLASKGGTIKMFNPADGQVVDTGIDSGSLSDMDLENLRGGREMTLQEMRDEAAMARTNRGGEQRMNEISARIKGDKEIAANKPISATQQKAAVENKIRELMTTRSDLMEFVDVDPNGNISIKADAPSDKYLEIRNFVYGEPKGSKTKTYTNSDLEPVPNASDKAPVASKVPVAADKPVVADKVPNAAGTVMMKTPDGRTVPIPMDKVDEAKKRGAVEVNASTAPVGTPAATTMPAKPLEPSVPVENRLMEIFKSFFAPASGVNYPDSYKRNFTNPPPGYPGNR